MATTDRRRAQLAREDALRAAYAWREQVEQHGGDVLGSRARAMTALAEWVQRDREARGVTVARLQAPVTQDRAPAADVFTCRHCGHKVDYTQRYHSDERGLWHWDCGPSAATA